MKNTSTFFFFFPCVIATCRKRTNIFLLKMKPSVVLISPSSVLDIVLKVKHLFFGYLCRQAPFLWGQVLLLKFTSRLSVKLCYQHLLELLQCFL